MNFRVMNEKAKKARQESQKGKTEIFIFGEKEWCRPVLFPVLRDLEFKQRLKSKNMEFICVVLIIKI